MVISSGTPGPYGSYIGIGLSSVSLLIILVSVPILLQNIASLETELNDDLREHREMTEKMWDIVLQHRLPYVHRIRRQAARGNRPIDESNFCGGVDLPLRDSPSGDIVTCQNGRCPLDNYVCTTVPPPYYTACCPIPVSTNPNKGGGDKSADGNDEYVIGYLDGGGLYGQIPAGVNQNYQTDGGSNQNYRPKGGSNPNYQTDGGSYKSYQTESGSNSDYQTDGSRYSYQTDGGGSQEGKCECSPVNNCPAGLPGRVGPAGNDGVDGDAGVPGVPGETELKEDSYLVDPSCAPCPSGEPGIPGRQGRKGNPGPPGIQGSLGSAVYTGIPGPPGLPGMPGRSADPGRVGLKGLPGENGYLSEPGPSGGRGPRGPLGPIGDQGVPGIPAIDGPLEGDIGLKGPSGDAGQPGIRGESGSIGTPGTPGNDASYCACPPRNGAAGATEQSYLDPFGRPNRNRFSSSSNNNENTQA